MWAPPPRFDGYELVRLLGHGGMGQVFLARDVLLDRHVAIKFIAAEVANQARERFVVEARAIARLQHPNVVAIFRVGEVEGRPYLVSEFVRGQPLDRVARPLPWREALRIAQDLARALSAAHRRGVVHRDIKPANVILSEEGDAKLLDFGLAKLLDSAEPHTPAQAPRAPDFEFGVAPLRDPDDVSPQSRELHTSPGVMLGTPGYMPPEVWRGEPATFGSDVYSLGVLLYVLCAGRGPHNTNQVAALCVLTCTEDAPPLAQVAPGVDASFAAVVDRCVRRNPAERYASGNELRAALAQLTPEARADVVPEGNPYRGLHPFEAQHRALYFGRDSEIRAILERLGAEGFVLVAGDSGVGKSSLCRAGVLPRIEDWLDKRRTWTRVELVPGRHPMASLAAALAPASGRPEEDLHRELAADARDVVRAWRGRQGPDAGVVLFIDQLEELLTLSAPEEAMSLAELVGWMAQGGPSLRVLATVRADFLGRLAALGGLADAVSRALYFLRPLSEERIREAIVGPARAKGVTFESESMVDELVQSTARASGGLPLLQFALAEVWEARDRAKGIISAAALDALGGVAGALSRHADTLLAGLPSSERAAARALLLRLVSADGTRVRRTGDELVLQDAPARAALEALVRGRIVVARETPEGSGYEIAHEALVRGWPTLGRWLGMERRDQALRERLGAASAEWDRTDRSRETLWRARQLQEVAHLSESGLAEREALFLAASRAALRRRRAVAVAAFVSIPLALGLIYGGVTVGARAALARRVDAESSIASRELAAARSKRAEIASLEEKAYALFDEPNRDAGELVWKDVRAAEGTVNAAFGRAARAAESALALDPQRRDVRTVLADVLFDRAMAADEQHLDSERDELLARLALYDDGGERRARWGAPALVSFSSEPPSTMTLERYVREPDGKRSPQPFAAPAGWQDAPLSPGSYRMNLRVAGRPPVFYPFSVSRGEIVHFDVLLPDHGDIPSGFVYVPPGRFLFGTQAEDSVRRGFFHTVPMHQVVTSAYLIALRECTFAQWIDFLRALPPAERPGRYPAVHGGFEGALTFRELPGERWELVLRPASVTYTARSGEPIVYSARGRRKAVDWTALPVVGVSADDAEAYAHWLATSRQVPGARLCTEREWERAARGADDRFFPHGDTLATDDADFDETYGRAPLSMGPDEVGSHPGSRSPFGLDDMSGNAWEWTRSSLGGVHAARGGSFYFDVNAARVSNREAPEPSFRDVSVGFRVCADAPPSAETARRADSAR